MKRILLLSLLLISSFGFGQEPVIEWQKSLGGTGTDKAETIKQTTDGGYVVAGYSLSNDEDVTGNNGFYDYWIVKLDSSGNITWQKSLGGTNQDQAYSIQQTTDGGYIVAGITWSNDGDVTGHHGMFDSWIVKLNASGDITWQKSLGGSYRDEAYSIQQTTDGGYIVAGNSYSNDGDVTGNNGTYDYWIIKLDDSGNITWQKSLGGSVGDFAYSIKQTADGGYIVAGRSDSNDGDVTGHHGSTSYSDAWIVKLDASGNIIWQKSLGGSGVDEAYSIEQTTNGSYIVAGHTESTDGDVIGNSGGVKYWVIKLDASGNIIWQKPLSLNNSNWSVAESIKQTADGGYVVTGYNNDGDFDFSVVKLDTSGNITWQKSIGGSWSDEARSIQQTTDGGFIVAGYSESTDGDVSGNKGEEDFWVVKLSPETLSINEYKTLKFNIYPNPTTKTFTISSEKLVNSAFKIIDSQGKEVLTGKMNGKEEIIDITKLSKGVYSVVFDNSELRTVSVIKE